MFFLQFVWLVMQGGCLLRYDRKRIAVDDLSEITFETNMTIFKLKKKDDSDISDTASQSMQIYLCCDIRSLKFGYVNLPSF